MTCRDRVPERRLPLEGAGVAPVACPLRSFQSAPDHNPVSGLGIPSGDSRRAAGRTRGQVVLPADGYDLTIQAELLTADKRTVLATACAPVRRLAVKLAVAVKLGSPARVQAKLDPKSAVTVEVNDWVERKNWLAGDVALTLTGLPAGVRADPKFGPETDRRQAYAAWPTAAENPFFARGLVNRFWSYFFNRGIVDSVDDIRSTIPPVNPAVLDALTADFVAHKFDARHLMRRIVTSATYQRSSTPTASNKRDELNFSDAIPRRIPAEALLDSLVQATGVPENIGGAPGGFRAAQLPDGAVDSDFLHLFGKPQRMDACECERDNGSNMLQALCFLNGKSILGRVKNPNTRGALLNSKDFLLEH